MSDQPRDSLGHKNNGYKNLPRRQEGSQELFQGGTGRECYEQVRQWIQRFLLNGSISNVKLISRKLSLAHHLFHTLMQLLEWWCITDKSLEISPKRWSCSLSFSMGMNREHFPFILLRQKMCKPHLIICMGDWEWLWKFNAILKKDSLLLPIHLNAWLSMPEVHIQSQTVLVFN